MAKNLNDLIEDMKKEQRAQTKAKQDLAKQIRNKEKQRKRMKDKASNLSNEDLIQILTMRGQSDKLASAAESSCAPGTPLL